MTDLGTLGGTFSEARAIDSTGDVVGTSTLSGTSFVPTHAFLDHNGHMTDLGTLGGSCSFTYGMNDVGEVVGQACTTNQVAFLYSGGKMTNLGTLGGLTSEALGINNAHQVVGSSETSTTLSSTLHAFLWNNGTMTDLGTLGGLAARPTPSTMPTRSWGTPRPEQLGARVSLQWRQDDRPRGLLRLQRC